MVVMKLGRNKITTRAGIAAAALAFVFILSGVARASLLDKIEWKTEKYFGKATRDQIADEYGFIDNPLLNDYFSKLGVSLSTVSDRTDIPYEFHVVNTNEVNAFAAPGGYVFVTRGLIDKVDSDDELAVVVGHEVGHVAAHHGAKNIKKLPFIIAGLSILANKGGETAERIGGMVLSLAQLHYSREDEYQADQLGVKYSYNAGYDPYAMVSFFNKLEAQNRTGNLSKLDVSLMSHPKTTSRIMKIQSYPELDKKNAAELTRIGDSYLERYNYSSAIEKYNAALEIDPKSAGAANGAALASLELDQFDAARAYAKKVLEADPQNQTALNTIALLDAGPRPAAPANEELAGPDEAKSANDALASAVMGLEDKIETLRAIQKNTSDQSAEINRQFDNSLEDYGRTANSITEYDEDRVNVLQGAAFMFSGIFNTLDAVDGIADSSLLLAQDALKRGRIALYLLNRGPVTKRMASSATLLANTIDSYENSLSLIKKNIDAGLDSSRKLYIESARVMDELQGTLTETDASILSMRARTLVDRMNGFSGELDEMKKSTERTQRQIDETVTSVRRSALDLNTLALDPNQERIYRKMFTRRFIMKDGTLEQILSFGYSYGSAALIQSRAMQQTVDLPAALGAPDASKQLERLLDSPPANENNGEDILLALAEMDLRNLTKDRPKLGLSKPADIDAAGLTTPAGEPLASDAELQAAWNAVSAGDAKKAMDIINARGGSKPATATSYKLLGLALKLDGQYDEAKDEFKSAAKKFPNDFQSHFFQANTYGELERYDDAMNEYRAALQMKPDYGPAHLGLAHVLAKNGDTAAAEAAYLDALRFGASPAQAHASLGLLYYNEGRIYEALDQFDASLKSDPNQPELKEIAARLR